jgi:hypothetical protein
MLLQTQNLQGEHGVFNTPILHHAWVGYKPKHVHFNFDDQIELNTDAKDKHQTIG